MISSRLGTHLFVRMPTRVGLLADVAEALRNAGVNIQAIGAYDKEGAGEFMLVTNDNPAAADALRALGAEVTEEAVVLVEMPDHPGSLEKAARHIATADINIEWVYATTAGGTSATAVFKVPEPERVVRLLWEAESG